MYNIVHKYVDIGTLSIGKYNYLQCLLIDSKKTGIWI